MEPTIAAHRERGRRSRSPITATTPTAQPSANGMRPLQMLQPAAKVADPGRRLRVGACRDRHARARGVIATVASAPTSVAPSSGTGTA